MAYLKFGLLLAILTFVHANLQSPCPHIFEYDSAKKSAGRWEGVLNFDSEFELSGMWIRVILDKKAEQLGHDHAEVVSDDHISWLIRMPNSTLTPGSPAKVPFWVKYNEKDGEPNVASIRLNARDVCPQKKEAVNISPCPGIFKYSFAEKDVEGKWFGELNLDSEFPLNGIWIRVYLDKPGTILPHGFGEVEPRDHNSFLIRNKEHVLKPGNTLKVPFIVKYDDPKNIPNISRVRLNARTVCESKLIPTTVRLTADDVKTEDHSSHGHDHGHGHSHDHTISPSHKAVLDNVHNHPHTH